MSMALPSELVSKLELVPVGPRSPLTSALSVFGSITEIFPPFGGVTRGGVVTGVFMRVLIELY